MYLDQPEGYSGHPIQQHRAPVGSITIASEILTEDEDFPKGFYLRRINGAEGISLIFTVSLILKGTSFCLS